MSRASMVRIGGDGDRKTVVRVTGGVGGKDYTLTNYFEASDGTKDSRAVIVKVR